MALRKVFEYLGKGIPNFISKVYRKVVKLLGRGTRFFFKKLAVFVFRTAEQANTQIDVDNQTPGDIPPVQQVNEETPLNEAQHANPDAGNSNADASAADMTVSDVEASQVPLPEDSNLDISFDMEAADTNSADIETVDIALIDMTVYTAIFDIATVDTTIEEASIIDPVSIDTNIVDTTTIDSLTVDQPFHVDIPIIDMIVDTTKVDERMVDVTTVDTPMAGTQTVDDFVIDTIIVDNTIVDAPLLEADFVDLEMVDRQSVDLEDIDTDLAEVDASNTASINTESVDTEDIDTEEYASETLDIELEALSSIAKWETPAIELSASSKFDRNFERFIRTDEDDEWMVPTIEFSELMTDSEFTNKALLNASYGLDLPVPTARPATQTPMVHSYKHILSGPATAVVEIVESEHINNNCVENTLVDDHIEDLDSEGDSSLESVINSNGSTSNGDESVRASSPDTLPCSEENSPQTTAVTLASTPSEAESSPKEEKLSTITITSADAAHTVTLDISQEAAALQKEDDVPMTIVPSKLSPLARDFEMTTTKKLSPLAREFEITPKKLSPLAREFKMTTPKNLSPLAREFEMPQNWEPITAVEERGVNFEGSFPVPGDRSADLQYAVTARFEIFWYLPEEQMVKKLTTKEMVDFNDKYTMTLEYPRNEPKATTSSPPKEDQTFAAITDAEIDNLQGYFPVPGATDRGLQYAISREGKVFWYIPESNLVKALSEDDMVTFNAKYTIEIEYVEPGQEEGLTIEEETSEQESEDNKKDITITHTYPVPNTDAKELLYAFGSDELIYWYWPETSDILKPTIDEQEIFFAVHPNAGKRAPFMPTIIEEEEEE
ncbi:hypothetical protein B0T24DRAFT_686607 [Lasiosphaeria ovina]|uniref:Uncharacterized protein n=1 Tax=Lasiosphaeria ovina TaxID=92902 RepID=A0AAE0NJ92_9PEZI|nr:hypothetical protein B0T24DRAFT_686607 [Lasiosphaeria ovina]